jgi:urease accessory protein
MRTFKPPQTPVSTPTRPDTPIGSHPHPSQFLIWQIIDSAFPAGSFAHSSGIEAAAALNLVSTDLPELLLASVRHLLYTGSPFASAVLAQPADFPATDRAFDAMLTGDVANRASRRQGAALLRASAETFNLPLLQTFRDTCPAQSPGHLMPVFGLLAAALDIPQPLMHQMLAFTTLRSLLSAATRLGLVGPLEAQRLLLQLAHPVQHLASSAADRSTLEATGTSPLLEIVQGTHDRLYSRLFQS